MRALSEVWGTNTHRAIGVAGSDATRLALALGPVRSVIRIIDRGKVPMSVDWAQVGYDDKGKPLSMSYTDFKGSRIAVNPIPILDRTMPVGKAVDVVIGCAMHEAGHCQHGTKDRYLDALITRDAAGKEVPVFRPMRLAAYLLNLADDVRTEAQTSREWPGFEPYFGSVLDYMWKDPDFDPGSSKTPAISTRISIVWRAVRYPDRIEDYRAAGTKALAPLGIDFDQEVRWWIDWQAEYNAGHVSVGESIQKALDQLREDEQTRREMAEAEQQERADEAAGEKARAQLERLMKEGIDGAPGVCITADGEVQPLTAEQAAAVKQLMKEGLVKAAPLFTDNDNKCSEVRVRKPIETTYSRRAYIGKPDALVEAMRAALVFRQDRPGYDLKLQKSGTLDDEELWRVGQGDYRVFGEKVIDARPDVFFGMLVDLSGSMDDGEKLPTAQRLAQTMLWALSDQDDIESMVWGHTGDGQNGIGSDVYRIWEPGDPMRRLGLITSLDHSNNYDSFSILQCVTFIKDQPQQQKVLIVLSDGIPSGSQYGGETAKAHVRRAVDWARTQGVEVIQIAVGSDLRPRDQAKMFGDSWVGYENDAKLIRDLTRVLYRFVR